MWKQALLGKKIKQALPIFILAAPNHEFTAGFTSAPLASTLTAECGTYRGLIGAGDVGVLECEDPPVGL